MASTTDGFKLAELDLEQRREGDVLGATQSGRRSHLRLLSLLRDEDLIADARAEAIALVDGGPGAGHAPGAGRLGRRAGRRGARRVPGEGLTHAGTARRA